MTIPTWHQEPIEKRHDGTSFDCVDEVLNDFLQRHARQSHEKGGAKTFLAIDDAGGIKILGFYSLSPASIAYERTPEIVNRGLARHEVPVFRLGRLAVDKSVQGEGLGGQLLLAAGRRCLYVAAEERAGRRMVRQLWRPATHGCSSIAGSTFQNDSLCSVRGWQAIGENAETLNISPEAAKDLVERKLEELEQLDSVITAREN